MTQSQNTERTQTYLDTSKRLADEGRLGESVVFAVMACALQTDEMDALAFLAHEYCKRRMIPKLKSAKMDYEIFKARLN